MDRVAPQIIMIVEVLVAQDQSIDPLAQKVLERYVQDSAGPGSRLNPATDQCGVQPPLSERDPRINPPAPLHGCPPRPASRSLDAS